MKKKPVPPQQADEVPPLLTYEVTPDPNPLPTSSDSNASIGKIHITLKQDHSGDIQCNRVIIAFNTGETQDDIYSTSPPPTCDFDPAYDHGDWQKITGDLNYPIGGDSQGNTSYFGFQNNTDGGAVDQDVMFIASGTVNKVAGQPLLNIVENSQGEDDAVPINRSKSFPINKIAAAPPALSVYNFMAYKEHDLNFQTLFTVNDKIQLAWKGNADTYTVYQGDKNIYSDKQTTLSDAITIDKTTTFILIGQRGTTQLSQSLTLTVAEPNLLASDIYIGGTP